MVLLTPDQRQVCLDTAAVLLSGACILHCLALPIAIGVLPALHIGFLEEPIFHILMILFVLPVSLLALTLGCRRHKDRRTLIQGGLGLLLLTVSALWGHDLAGETGERILTSIGGLVLATAHIRNYRCCRAANCSHEH